MGILTEFLQSLIFITHVVSKCLSNVLSSTTVWFQPHPTKLFLLNNVLSAGDLHSRSSLSVRNGGSNNIQHVKPFSDIPGPRSFPVIGSQWLYNAWLFGPYTYDKLHLANEDKFLKYGPIVKEHYFREFPIVHLFAKNDIEEVLKYPSKYPIRPGMEAMTVYRKSRPDRYKSVGIVNSQGHEWHHLRSKLTSQLTSPSIITQTIEQVSAISDEFIHKLRKERSTDSRVEKFEKAMYLFSLESIVAVLLDRRLGALQDSVPAIVERLTTAAEKLFEVCHETMYGLPWWKYFPSKAYTELTNCEDVIYEVFAAIVVEALSAGDVESYPPVFRQILTAEDVDTRDKIATVIDLVGGGIETNGNFTLSLLHNIVTNPEVKARVSAELDAVLPSAATEITPQLLSELKYLRACISESFRLNPVAPNVARLLEKPFTFQNYHLPAGTVVVCQTWVASLQEDNYANAREFRPERWLGSGTNSNPFLTVPFGVGRRMCPGKRVSEQEILILTAKLLRNFDIEFDKPLEQVYKFLMSPNGPVNVTLKDRKIL